MSESSHLATPLQTVELRPFLGASSVQQSEEDRRKAGLRQLRRLIAAADRNGLADAVIRLNERRLLIDLDRFDAWLESRRLTAA